MAQRTRHGGVSVLRRGEGRPAPSWSRTRPSPAGAARRVRRHGLCPWLAETGKAASSYGEAAFFDSMQSLFPREGGDPVWAPAFAGEQGRVSSDPTNHPGGGRVPIGIRRQLPDVLHYSGRSDWAPAFAAVGQQFAEKAASSPEEAAFSNHASHGQSPCRRTRRAAPAGLGRVLRQGGAGRPAPYLGRGPPNGSGGVGRRSRRGSCAWYA